MNFEEALAAFWGKRACQADLHWKPAYTLLVCLAGTCTAVMAGSLGPAFPSSQLLNRLPLVIETSILKTIPPLGKEEVVPLLPWMCVSSCSLWMSVLFWWPAVSYISGDFFHLFIIWKVCIFVLGVLYHPGWCWFCYCQQNSRHLQETAQCCPQPLPFRYKVLPSSWGWRFLACVQLFSWTACIRNEPHKTNWPMDWGRMLCWCNR